MIKIEQPDEHNIQAEPEKLENASTYNNYVLKRRRTRERTQ